MKLATLHLDDHVVIPGGRQLGDMTGELRSDAFRSVDGWDIHETLPGVFSLAAPWMTEPVTIGGYGYSYTTLPAVRPIDTKGKKR